MCDFDKATVKLDPPMGLVMFLINIFFPGCGTMISACMDKGGLNSSALIYGVVEFILTIIIIGWCMSIYHGYLIWQKSEGK